MAEEKVAILIKKLSLEFEKKINPIFSEHNLTGSQYKVIKYLYRCPDHTSRLVDIEKCYSMTHPTTIGILKNLEKKGFITGRPNPNDKRSRLISLTPLAESMQPEMEKLGDDIEKMLTSKLNTNQYQELIKLLELLLEENAS